jgi:hypothetical protein
MRPLGAARDLAPDENWQASVQGALHASTTIIVILGTTSGLNWELQTIKELNYLRKVIIVFPPTGVHYDAIHPIVQELIPLHDPAMQCKKSLLMFSDSVDRWQLVISDQRWGQDYERALILAIELSGLPAVDRDGCPPWSTDLLSGMALVNVRAVALSACIRASDYNDVLAAYARVIITRANTIKLVRLTSAAAPMKPKGMLISLLPTTIKPFRRRVTVLNKHAFGRVGNQSAPTSHRVECQNWPGRRVQ